MYYPVELFTSVVKWMGNQVVVLQVSFTHLRAQWLKFDKNGLVQSADRLLWSQASVLDLTLLLRWFATNWWRQTLQETVAGEEWLHFSQRRKKKVKGFPGKISDCWRVSSLKDPTFARDFDNPKVLCRCSFKRVSFFLMRLAFVHRWKKIRHRVCIWRTEKHPRVMVEEEDSLKVNVWCSTSLQTFSFINKTQHFSEHNLHGHVGASSTYMCARACVWVWVSECMCMCLYVLTFYISHFLLKDTLWLLTFLKHKHPVSQPLLVLNARERRAHSNLRRQSFQPQSNISKQVLQYIGSLMSPFFCVLLQ